MPPVLLETMVPFRYMKRAGMLRTPSWPAVAWFWSVSTLATTISRSLATASRTGPMALHGAHHGAQKSTITHSELLTVSLNSASEMLRTSPMSSPNSPPNDALYAFVPGWMRLCLHNKPHQMASTGTVKGHHDHRTERPHGQPGRP